jgi:hypothetical protein
MLARWGLHVTKSQLLPFRQKLPTIYPNQRFSLITMAAAKSNPYVVEKNTTVAELKASEAFQALTEKEALYAHELHNAAW